MNGGNKMIGSIALPHEQELQVQDKLLLSNLKDNAGLKCSLHPVVRLKYIGIERIHKPQVVSEERTPYNDSLSRNGATSKRTKPHSEGQCLDSDVNVDKQGGKGTDNSGSTQVPNHSQVTCAKITSKVDSQELQKECQHAGYRNETGANGADQDDCGKLTPFKLPKRRRGRPPKNQQLPPKNRVQLKDPHHNTVNTLIAAQKRKPGRPRKNKLHVPCHLDSAKTHGSVSVFSPLLKAKRGRPRKPQNSKLAGLASQIVRDYPLRSLYLTSSKAAVLSKQKNRHRRLLRPRIHSEPFRESALKMSKGKHSKETSRSVTHGQPIISERIQQKLIRQQDTVCDALVVSSEVSEKSSSSHSNPTEAKALSRIASVPVESTSLENGCPHSNIQKSGKQLQSVSGESCARSPQRPEDTRVTCQTKDLLEQTMIKQLPSPESSFDVCALPVEEVNSRPLLGGHATTEQLQSKYERPHGNKRVGLAHKKPSSLTRQTNATNCSPSNCGGNEGWGKQEAKSVEKIADMSSILQGSQDQQHALSQLPPVESESRTDRNGNALISDKIVDLGTESGISSSQRMEPPLRATNCKAASDEYCVLGSSEWKDESQRTPVNDGQFACLTPPRSNEDLSSTSDDDCFNTHNIGYCQDGLSDIHCSTNPLSSTSTKDGHCIRKDESTVCSVPAIASNSPATHFPHSQGASVSEGVMESVKETNPVECVSVLGCVQRKSDPADVDTEKMPKEDVMCCSDQTSVKTVEAGTSSQKESTDMPYDDILNPSPADLPVCSLGLSISLPNYSRASFSMPRRERKNIFQTLGAGLMTKNTDCDTSTKHRATTDNVAPMPEDSEIPQLEAYGGSHNPESLLQSPCSDTLPVLVKETGHDVFIDECEDEFEFENPVDSEASKDSHRTDQCEKEIQLRHIQECNSNSPRKCTNEAKDVEVAEECSLVHQCETVGEPVKSSEGVCAMTVTLNAAMDIDEVDKAQSSADQCDRAVEPVDSTDEVSHTTETLNAVKGNIDVSGDFSLVDHCDTISKPVDSTEDVSPTTEDSNAATDLKVINKAHSSDRCDTISKPVDSTEGVSLTKEDLNAATDVKVINKDHSSDRCDTISQPVDSTEGVSLTKEDLNAATDVKVINKDHSSGDQCNMISKPDDSTEDMSLTTEDLNTSTDVKDINKDHSSGNQCETISKPDSSTEDMSLTTEDLNAGTDVKDINKNHSSADQCDTILKPVVSAGDVFLTAGALNAAMNIDENKKDQSSANQLDTSSKPINSTDDVSRLTEASNAAKDIIDVVVSASSVRQCDTVVESVKSTVDASLVTESLPEVIHVGEEEEDEFEFETPGDSSPLPDPTNKLLAAVELTAVESCHAEDSLSDQGIPSENLTKPAVQKDTDQGTCQGQLSEGNEPSVPDPQASHPITPVTSCPTLGISSTEGNISVRKNDAISHAEDSLWLASTDCAPKCSNSSRDIEHLSNSLRESKKPNLLDQSFVKDKIDGLETTEESGGQGKESHWDASLIQIKNVFSYSEINAMQDSQDIQKHSSCSGSPKQKEVNKKKKGKGRHLAGIRLRGMKDGQSKAKKTVQTTCQTSSSNKISTRVSSAVKTKNVTSLLKSEPESKKSHKTRKHKRCGGKKRQVKDAAVLPPVIVCDKNQEEIAVKQKAKQKEGMDSVTQTIDEELVDAHKTSVKSSSLKDEVILESNADDPECPIGQPEVGIEQLQGEDGLFVFMSQSTDCGAHDYLAVAYEETIQGYDEDAMSTTSTENATIPYPLSDAEDPNPAGEEGEDDLSPTVNSQKEVPMRSSPSSHNNPDEEGGRCDSEGERKLKETTTDGDSPIGTEESIEVAGGKGKQGIAENVESYEDKSDEQSHPTILDDDESPTEISSESHSAISAGRHVPLGKTGHCVLLSEAKEECVRNVEPTLSSSKVSTENDDAPSNSDAPSTTHPCKTPDNVCRSNEEHPLEARTGSDEEQACNDVTGSHPPSQGEDNMLPAPGDNQSTSQPMPTVKDVPCAVPMGNEQNMSSLTKCNLNSSTADMGIPTPIYGTPLLYLPISEVGQVNQEALSTTSTTVNLSTENIKQIPFSLATSTKAAVQQRSRKSQQKHQDKATFFGTPKKGTPQVRMAHPNPLWQYQGRFITPGINPVQQLRMRPHFLSAQQVRYSSPPSETCTELKQHLLKRKFTPGAGKQVQNFSLQQQHQTRHSPVDSLGQHQQPFSPLKPMGPTSEYNVAMKQLKQLKEEQFRIERVTGTEGHDNDLSRGTHHHPSFMQSTLPPGKCGPENNIIPINNAISIVNVQQPLRHEGHMVTGNKRMKASDGSVVMPVDRMHKERGSSVLETHSEFSKEKSSQLAPQIMSDGIPVYTTPGPKAQIIAIYPNSLGLVPQHEIANFSQSLQRNKAESTSPQATSHETNTAMPVNVGASQDMMLQYLRRLHGGNDLKTRPSLIPEGTSHKTTNAHHQQDESIQSTPHPQIQTHLPNCIHQVQRQMYSTLKDTHVDLNTAADGQATRLQEGIHHAPPSYSPVLSSHRQNPMRFHEGQIVLSDNSGRKSYSPRTPTPTRYGVSPHLEQAVQGTTLGSERSPLPYRTPSSRCHSTSSTTSSVPGMVSPLLYLSDQNMGDDPAIEGEKPLDLTCKEKNPSRHDPAAPLDLSRKTKREEVFQYPVHMIAQKLNVQASGRLQSPPSKYEQQIAYAKNEFCGNRESLELQQIVTSNGDHSEGNTFLARPHSKMPGVIYHEPIQARMAIGLDSQTHNTHRQEVSPQAIPADFRPEMSQFPLQVRQAVAPATQAGPEGGDVYRAVAGYPSPYNELMDSGSTYEGRSLLISRTQNTSAIDQEGIPPTRPDVSLSQRTVPYIALARDPSTLPVVCVQLQVPPQSGDALPNRNQQPQAHARTASISVDTSLSEGSSIKISNSKTSETSENSAATTNNVSVPGGTNASVTNANDTPVHVTREDASGGSQPVSNELCSSTSEVPTRQTVQSEEQSGKTAPKRNSSPSDMSHCPKKRYKRTHQASLSISLPGNSLPNPDALESSNVANGNQTHSESESKSVPAQDNTKPVAEAAELTTNPSPAPQRRRRGRPKGSGKNPSAKDLAKLEAVRQQCKFCEFVAMYRQDMIQHVKETHFKKHRDKLTSTKETANVQGNIDVALPTSNAKISCGRMTEFAQFQTVTELPNLTPCLLQHQETPNNPKTATVENHHMGNSEQNSKDRQGQNVPAAAHKDADEGALTELCQYCPLAFSDTSSLVDHQRTSHPLEDAMFRCRLCDYKHSSPGPLVVHVTRKHMKQLKDQCPFQNCYRTFSEVKDLKKHLDDHWTEKQYACRICGVRYSVFNSLKAHLDRHKQELGNTCKVCTMSFKTPGTLLRHKKQRGHMEDT